MYASPEYVRAVQAERIKDAESYRRAQMAQANRRPSAARRIAAALRRIAYAAPR